MLLLSCLPPDPATGTEYLTRGEAAELANALQRGIVEGTSATVFDPGVPVTRDQLEQLIRGTCALEGSSLKDDVYAAVNREHITAAALYPGYGRLAPASNMSIQVNADMRNIIGEIA